MTEIGSTITGLKAAAAEEEEEEEVATGVAETVVAMAERVAGV